MSLLCIYCSVAVIMTISIVCRFFGGDRYSRLATPLQNAGFILLVVLLTKHVNDELTHRDKWATKVAGDSVEKAAAIQNYQECRQSGFLMFGPGSIECKQIALDLMVKQHGVKDTASLADAIDQYRNRK